VLDQADKQMQEYLPLKAKTRRKGVKEKGKMQNAK